MRIPFFLLIACFVLSACHSTETPPVPSYNVDKDQIVVPEGSPFKKHLEIVQAKVPEHAEVVFNTVGQIIALANSSSELSGQNLSWVELEPSLTASAGLRLNGASTIAVGTAYGLTSIPAEYTEQIHVGESVDILRYGLKKSDVHGTVIRIEPRHQDKNSLLVTFQIQKGQDWYPGTNCEVKFPLLHVQTSVVPTTAVLHEGFREFVLKQVSPGHFQVLPIFIVDETPGSAQVIGLKNGDSLIGSGAILLKPELHNFIRSQTQQEKETSHVPE